MSEQASTYPQHAVTLIPQYFDELRGLLPYGGDSAKFDKNAILHHSILLIRRLIQDLDDEQVSTGK